MDEHSTPIAPGTGVWHLVHMVEPGQLVHITPGPHGEHRPLPAG